MIENKLDGNYRWVTCECQNAGICVLKWPGRDASIALLSSLCFGMFYSKRALEVWRGQLSIFPALVQAPSVLLAAVLCRCEEQRRSQSWPNHWEFLFQPLVRSLGSYLCPRTCRGQAWWGIVPQSLHNSICFLPKAAGGRFGNSTRGSRARCAGLKGRKSCLLFLAPARPAAARLLQQRL